MTKKENKDCFVIMPIAECEGYEPDHFAHVYNDIIKPAVARTDYIATRADEVKETNLIHLDILKKLIDAPIAICDLSTRNPNVLFELGIRQAFDKPVVLIQEKGTPKIFDIGPLRYLEYSKEMRYHEVIESQNQLCEAINATKNAENEVGNVNSIVKLMALNSPALMPKLDNNNKELLSIDVVRSQMSDLRMMIERMLFENHRSSTSPGSITVIEYGSIVNRLDQLHSDRIFGPETEREYSNLMMEAHSLLNSCENERDRRMVQNLISRISRQQSDVFRARNLSR